MLDLSLAALVDAFRRKAFTPLDYWDALEKHIEAWEPHIKALYAYEPAAARSQAEASTKRWARGEPVGPLDGVPVTVKELIATKGHPIPQGCAAIPRVAAEADAPPAARLREAGAIIFAKTTVPDLAMLSSGLSSFYGITRNPWNLTRNPGGSSAGAGAAGAAGYGPLHIGTDIGGSIRLPAAWCGLVGFKPSLGRIPIDPYYPGRAAGPMTRTVEDAALSMDVLSRPDPRDATSLPWQDIDWTALETKVRGLRIGLMQEAGAGIVADAQTQAAVAAAARVFEAAGAIVEMIEPVLTPEILDGIDQFWRARAWNEIRALPQEKLDLLLPYIFEWAKSGETVPGWRAVDGFNQTLAIRKRAAALFDGLDAVLSPTNSVTSFAAELPSPQNDPLRPFDHIVYTLPWNMSEQPALSINCGWSGEGLPIGLQIAGPRFEDLAVLRLAKFYEDARGPITNWPLAPHRKTDNSPA
jgi:aspartyl-tRNA(Asn)/glutamyl-tRNA(Gln) amidotransferase subunit A